MNEETKLMGGLSCGPHDFEDEEINPWLEEEHDSPSRPVYGPWHRCWGMSPDEKEEWDWRHDLPFLEKLKAARQLPPLGSAQREQSSREEYDEECVAWSMGKEYFEAWKKKKETQDYYND